jgi:hypothetical protein
VSDPEQRDLSGWRIRRQYLHVFITAACVLPFLSYVLGDAGWGPQEIGYATATLAVSGIVAAPAWGWLDDELPGAAPRAALLATAVAALGIAASVRSPRHGLVIAAVALFGASSGSLEALLTTRTLRSASTAGRLGGMRSAGSLGWVIGLALGATALTFAPHQPAWLFVIAAVGAVTSPRPRATGGRRGVRRARASIPLRPILGVLSVTLPVPLAISTLVQFTAGWAHRDLHAGPYAAVAPIALSAALELPAFFLVDRISRGRRSLVVIAAAMPPLALALCLLAAFPGELTLLCVQPLVATSFALWFVGQSRRLFERVAAERLATGQTLGGVLSRGIAGPTAGLAGGAIAGAAGFSAMFAALATLLALGTLRCAVALRNEGVRLRSQRAAPPSTGSVVVAADAGVDHR